MPEHQAPPVATASPAAASLDDTLHRKLVWLTLFRLGMITVLLGGTAMVNWQFGPRAAEVVAPLYAVVGLTYGVSLGMALLLRLRRGERAVAAAQVVLDVLIAAVVVATTGYAESVFVSMFLLAIVNGSILLHRGGAVVALVLSIGAYTLVLGGAPAPGVLHGTVFAHLSAFVATAALAGYLAEQLRRAGQRLAESESDLAAVTALHESIVQSVTSGLLTLDPKGRITFMNRAGEQITGLALHEIVGEPAGRFFPEFKATSRGEAQFVSRAGQTQLLGYTAFALKRGEASKPGVAVIFQDLTELRAMELAMERSKRLADLGQVAAGLAHELRNPLASISGCVELLRGAQGLSPEEQRILGIVLRETSRLDDLLTRFLAFSRPPPSEFRPTDLAAIVGETLDMFATDPGSAGLTIERSLVPSPIECDADQLRQVAWNLLTNAAQAIRGGTRGTRLRVTCEPTHGGGVRAVFEDDGPGISSADLGRIFTPFFTTKASGTGLGLAEVQRIVDAHGGAIAVESSPGAGARFEIRLPPRGSAAPHRPG